MHTTKATRRLADLDARNLRRKWSADIVLSVEPQREDTVETESKHEHFCFAGQPAQCEGYFADDVLPCVCGVEGDVIAALSRVAIPSPLGGTPILAGPARAKPKPAEDEAA